MSRVHEDERLTESEREVAKDGIMTDTRYRITDHLYEWCQSKESVSSLLAADPNLTPGDAWHKLFHGHRFGVDTQEHIRDVGKYPITDEEMQRARQCGKWGPNEPSNMFIRIYHDALCTLNDDPGRGMISPSLMGSSGTMPLTVISVVPDIVRHMSNLIARAEKEVFLATNFWQNGVASQYITNAIRELSRRAQARGTRVVMKIIYDRGNPRQIIDPHHVVSESEYTSNAVNLPPAKDIPYVDLQVINYHQPLLGTFHAKYMIIDRRIGIVQSDNIQDNDNMEMMVHVEGPIVDSLYDMAMISWHKKLDPTLPCLRSHGASAGGVQHVGASHTNTSPPDGSIKEHQAVVDPAKMSARKPYGIEATTTDGVIKDTSHQDSPIENLGNGSTITNPSRNNTGKDHPLRQNEDGQAVGEVSLQTSAINDSTANPTVSATYNQGSRPGASSPPHVSETSREHTIDDPHYDSDLEGEVSRVQGVVSAKPDETAMQAITRHLNHTFNEGFTGNAPDCSPADEMTPYIPHPIHEPFPMALVCRAPYGRPNHKSTVNPQNAAWLSALRNAERNVFIQTPNLNAEPLVPAIKEACERGIDVFCYVCLGYNDSGEMLPMQGGHNEKIAHQLYTSLSVAGRQHLRWHWYVAKDQTRPIPAAQKKRSCHIKLMIADERVGIIGNGNQDTQSWFHSQEINLMIDSPQICRSWIDALRRNQNTGLYGEVGVEDGIWRDEHGKEVDGATGVDAGRFSWAKGLVGAVKRAQGTGGF
ncbi:phospholipase D/nuclease [Xylariaceae sp. FL1651]|nr:phospholipase D/nuclease [Xylariaceae sp. FL1651]